jgi:hypothetical protein
METESFMKKHLELAVMEAGYTAMLDFCSKGGYDELNEPTIEETGNE